jgi:putative flippase GtrA
MTMKTTAVGSSISPPAGSPERRRILRFAVVGTLSVAIDFTGYWLLNGTFSPHVAKGISFLLGMIVGFVGNKFWTFESQQRSASEPAIYFLLYAITLLVNIAINAVLLDFTTGKVFAFLAATGTTTILNYLGLRLLAFRTAARKQDQQATPEPRRIAA